MLTQGHIHSSLPGLLKLGGRTCAAVAWHVGQHSDCQPVTSLDTLSSNHPVLSFSLAHHTHTALG